MTKTSIAWTLVVAGLLATTSLPMLAQGDHQGRGQAIITVLPKNEKGPDTNISQQAVQIEVNGKRIGLDNWTPFHGSQTNVELVLLIDGGARESLGREWDDITHFVQGLPPNVRFSLGYMENGRAVLGTPLTTDHARALQSLHLPVGVPGYSASPYFCLSDLAKHWPSTDRSARREAILITDGVDYYERRYDPDDPYVQAAISDAARARLVVYSIYWKNVGRGDRGWYATDSGQNLLAEVTQSLGGNSYWIGFGNPVTLSPYFDDFERRLRNQYELGFTAPLRGKPEVETLKVKVNAPDIKVTAPQRVFVTPPEASPE